MRHVLGSLFVLAVAAAPAGAEPAFSTLDRAEPASRAGVDFGVGFYDDQALFDQTALRIDVHAQYVASGGGGGYLGVPMAVLFIDDAIPLGGDDEEFSLGNVEVGGLYALAQGSGWFLLRGGLALPTADDSGLGAIAQNAAAPIRLTDAALAVPETTWLRLGVSYLGRGGPVFYRLDGGIDVPVAEPEGADPDALLRLNLGVGYQAGPAAISAELVTAGDEDFSHTLALAARFLAGDLRPSVGFLLPLDDELRQSGFDFAVLFGLHGVMPQGG